METDPGDIDGFEFSTAGAFAGMHVDFLQVDSTETDLVDVYGGDCVYTPTNFLADASCMGAWLLDGTGSTEAGDNKCEGETDDGTWYDVNDSGWANATDPDGGSNATEFDGVDDIFWVAHDVKYLAADTTIGCWANPDAVNEGNLFFNKGSSTWKLLQTTSNRARFDINANGENSPTNTFEVTDGWVHVAGRHIDDANDYLEMFIDGEAACDGACNDSVGDPTGTNILGMGARKTSSTADEWDGQLYECWMMDRGLSDYEICEICRFGLDGAATDRTAQCGACDYTP
jgi:hypothetical protein